MDRKIVKCLNLVLVLVLGSVWACAVRAQEVSAPQLPAPPPLRVIARAERNQLSEARDAKTRIRTIVELATAHLQQAEQLTSQQKYDQVLKELGAYLALIEDGLKFLGQMNHDSGKTRDLYKRLELALRADGPRLTAMRRITPLEYAIRVKEAEDFARDGRTEALNSFYGHTVVRDGGQKKPDAENGTKGAPNKPENRQP